MSDYVIFARKFRPQKFEDVVGQEPITTTLKNAISQQRIPQSFLFSGPRGVGKTSVARILAKALNCVEGPAEIPCGKCDSCLEITRSNSMDVLEIDGASNRGIDEIRNLRDNVKFKPTTGKFKLYIIDEVHMLTTEAFNALLKTLEEPPAHVKFIFATTESHKVPLTILSRCQRFNFKRISTAEITAKLEEIAGREKINYEKNALFLVAKASEGALRDAESLLDQLASFAGEKIKEEDVLFLLGLASEEIFFQTLDALHEKDGQAVFALIARLYEGGKDLVQFAKGMLEIFRHLLIFQCAGKAEDFIEMSEEGIAGLKQRKDYFSRGELLLGLSILGNLQAQMRRNLAPPKLLMEAALLKLLHLDGLRSPEDVVESTGVSRAASPQPAAPRPAGPASPAPARAPAQKKNEPASPREVTPPSAPPSATASEEIPQTTATAEEAPHPPSPAGSSVSLNQIEAGWPQILEYVKSKRMSIGIFLSESEPVETGDQMITLGLPSEFQFHKETLEKNANRKLIEEAVENVLGCQAGVQFVITRSGEEKKTVGKPQGTSGEEKGELPDIIVKALDIFDGGRIVRKD